ncbi:YbaN family protein [Thalassotalea crassostreae]|uniref:YbaN family protein n=1 Tax=Thalassotalea crassostreae TaxID=1763536 RepID=UPI000838B24C|nr:YbaN family protein [Thalassotalea crassostreae]
MKRYLLIAVGFGFVALALAGVVLPVLPTTPFLLVAAACFAKSSKRCHQWLLNNKLFGPILHNWHHRRCIPLKAKRIAMLSIIVFGGSSVIMLPNVYGQIATIVLLLIGFLVVYNLKVCQSTEPSHK